MSVWSQSFPPKPTFTEASLGSLSGKVYLVTGGYSGCGLELSRILYHKGGRVLIVGRNEKSYISAANDIKTNPSEFLEKSDSPGSLEFVQIDLSDLTTIKPAVEKLLPTIDRLDVAWYNAGVMIPPSGSLSKQGYELQWGTNVVGHFLLNKLLTPILNETAMNSPAGSVRALWAGSLAHHAGPKPYGINFEQIGKEGLSMGSSAFYAQSKAGNVILAAEFAARSQAAAKTRGGANPVISLAFNPGNLKSNLQRHSAIFQWRIFSCILYNQRFGGLTELFGGLSPEIGDDFNGGYVIPFGRKGKVVKHVLEGITAHGTGAQLWKILEDDVAPYL
ncbi:uncharacterized protein V1516DRAFT_24141 [Lipomyces oligophaga]|uniref:uncharacterized protein n=1 Tax=Lipomyces oligophaga TaxID=45792 RepID=UPI0034CE2E0B